MTMFDILLIGDFRFPGGTSVAAAHEIRALAAAGMSIGLVQVNAEILKQNRPVHALINACITRGEAIQVTAAVPEARLAIIHNPMVFAKRPQRMPRVKAKNAILVAHQPHTDRNGVPYYNAGTVHARCLEIVGGNLSWAPISPSVRDNLLRTAPHIPLTSQDWHNILFLDEWASDRSRPAGRIPVIGRHSRPDKDKWPATRSDILQVYPDNPSLEIRLLGVGDHVRRIVGEFPANWTAFRFGQMDPREFLKTIDFFAYYHHPDWFEAFGRTVMEACASGAVAILPPHFETTFGEAAIYREPAEAIPTALELYGNWKRYTAQSRRAQGFIARHHGPDRHVGFISGLMGVSLLPPLKPVPSRTSLPSHSQDTDMRQALSLHLSDPSYDVVIMADMRTPGDVGLRISHEVRIQHAHGFRTALVHVPTNRIKSHSVRGELHACIRDGMAQVLTPSDTVTTRLLIIHGPEDILEPIPDKLPRILAEKIVVVATRQPDRTYNVMRKHRLLALAFQAQPTWAPATPQLRDALQKAWPEVPLESEDWSVSLATRAWKDRVLTWDRLVVGRIDSEVPLDFGKTDKPDAKPSLQPSFNGCYLRILQAQPAGGEPMPGAVDQLTIEEQAVGKFLDSLDVLYVDQDDLRPVPHCAVAEAMQRGVIVLVKGEMARELGPGALGCGPSKADETIKILGRNRPELNQLACETSRNASARFAASIHAERIARLTGKPAELAKSLPSKRQSIAFITSNGVGLGHLTRLLCIARRLPSTVDPIFVTMSQAFGIVKDFGFPVEYVPFSSQSEASGVNDWNDWFKHHIEQVFDAYGITGAVFDGGAPYGGLVKAIASRPDMFSVWVRRGMWKPGKANDNLIKRQKYFDLVIEPRDVAGARDFGPTAGQHGRAAHVDPIRLLDSEELLDRKSAAKALGIDPSKPAVLIQLGSGTTSEIVSQTNDVIKACARFPQLQIVIAEWAIGAVSFDVWPNVKVLRGFPLSRYFNAFDFTISAVGYNSFNEIMSFGLPAVFIANENPIMDDQAGRAAYAVEQGAAFMTSPEEIKDLHLILEALMDERARAIIKVNAARIAMANGAQDAANLIVRLAGVQEEAIDNPEQKVLKLVRKPIVRKPAKKAPARPAARARTRAKERV
jgi:predicted glycosyltransferase